jgi:hypothetical protein
MVAAIERSMDFMAASPTPSRSRPGRRRAGGGAGISGLGGRFLSIGPPVVMG